MTERKNSIGSNFDEFLADDGLLAEVKAAAAQRVITLQIGEATPMRTTSFPRKRTTEKSAPERQL